MNQYSDPIDEMVLMSFPSNTSEVVRIVLFFEQNLFFWLSLMALINTPQQRQQAGVFQYISSDEPSVNYPADTVSS